MPCLSDLKTESYTLQESGCLFIFSSDQQCIMLDPPHEFCGTISLPRDQYNSHQFTDRSVALSFDLMAKHEINFILLRFAFFVSVNNVERLTNQSYNYK